METSHRIDHSNDGHRSRDKLAWIPAYGSAGSPVTLNRGPACFPVARLTVISSSLVRRAAASPEIAVLKCFHLVASIRESHCEQVEKGAIIVDQHNADWHPQSLA